MGRKKIHTPETKAAAKREQQRIKRLDPEYRKKKNDAEKARVAAMSPTKKAERNAQIKAWSYTPRGIERKKAYYARPEIKERYRQYGWKRNGIPTPTRPRPELCECCGSPPRKIALQVDHCHSTGKFRGWLCAPCNRGIGLIGDTFAAVERVADYFKRAGFDLI